MCKRQVITNRPCNYLKWLSKRLYGIYFILHLYNSTDEHLFLSTEKTCSQFESQQIKPIC